MHPDKMHQHYDFQNIVMKSNDCDSICTYCFSVNPMVGLMLFVSVLAEDIGGGIS
jgi:hypothetical protein